MDLFKLRGLGADGEASMARALDPVDYAFWKLGVEIVDIAVSDWKTLLVRGKRECILLNQGKDTVRVSRGDLRTFFYSDWFVDLACGIGLDVDAAREKLGVTPPTYGYRQEGRALRRRLERAAQRRFRAEVGTARKKRGTRGPNNKSSKYRGVTKVGEGRFRVQLHVGRRSKHVGYYHNERAAARAYDTAARAEYGPAARLNFPGGDT